MHAPIEVTAGHGTAFRLGKGKAVRIVNTHGTQVVDCWAWNAADLTEHMSMEASRVYTQRLNPAVGDSFVTTKRRPILTLVEDTSPRSKATAAHCRRAPPCRSPATTSRCARKWIVSSRSRPVRRTS